MKVAEGRIQKSLTDIEAEERRLDNIHGGSHSRRREELVEKKADEVNARAKLEEHDTGLSKLEDSKRQAEHELDRSHGPLKAKRDDVQQSEQRLNILTNDRGQRQGAYQASMPRLLNAIRQDDGFQQPPVGPIGSHVRLLKPLWSSILEKSFGGALNSFVVISKQDQARLSDLMQKTGW